MLIKHKTIIYLIGTGILLIALTALFLFFFLQSMPTVSNEASEKIDVKNELFNAVTSRREFKGTEPEPPTYGRENPFAPHQ